MKRSAGLVLREMLRTWWRGLILVFVIPGWLGVSRSADGAFNPRIAVAFALIGALVWAYNGWMRVDDERLSQRR